MTRRILTATLLLTLGACTGPTTPPKAQPAPSPTASPTPEPSRTPSPPEWADDPVGKAACDKVRPYADGQISRPPAAALLAIAELAMKAKRASIAAAGVDLAVAARNANVPNPTTVQRLELVGNAIRLGTVCTKERYYQAEPWPPATTPGP